MLWFILFMAAICLVVLVYIAFRKCGRSSVSNVRRTSNPNIERDNNVAADDSALHAGGNEDKARTYIGLAQSNFKLGKIKEAEKHIDAALAVDPRNEAARQVKELLSSFTGNDESQDKANRIVRVLDDLGLAKPGILKEIAESDGINSIKPIEELLLCVKQLETPSEGVIPKTPADLEESTNEFGNMYRAFLDRLYECAGIMEALGIKDGEGGARNLWAHYIACAEGHSGHKTRLQKAEEHLNKLGGPLE